MLEHLFLTNIYFVVYVFAALTFFASGWIHLDSWKIDKKNLLYLGRSIGFFSVSVSLLITSLQSSNWVILYSLNILKIYGGLMLLISLIGSPILKKPNSKSAVLFSFPAALTINNLFMFISPLLFLFVTVSYFVRVFKGLEKQVKGAATALLLFTIAEFLKILYLGSGSSVVFINNFLSRFGPLTLIVLTLTMISSTILFMWVWGYVRFRAGTQIFITTLSLTLAVFLITTVSFTFLLIKSIEQNILGGLETSANIVQYSIEKLQFEAMANSKAIAVNQDVAALIESDDRSSVFELINPFMLDQNLAFLDITDDEGELISAAEDADLRNVSLLDNPAVASALDGKPLSTISKNEAALTPIVEVSAASPIYSEDKVIGSVVSGFLVDSAFLDGIKTSTGIEIDIYADSVKSASTTVLDEGNTRLIGTKLADKDIYEGFLRNQKSWKGAGKIANKPYFFAFVPLKSHGEKVIGMISTGKPQSVLSELSQKAIESTFLISAFLMIASIIPAFLISRYIEENITA